MDIRTIWEKYKIWIVGGGALLLFAAAAYALLSPAQNVEVMAYEPEPSTEEPSPEEMMVEEATIFVEVKGAVKYPGVFELPPDARVKNVLEMAQLKTEADLLTVNQSMKLTDEMVIYVPVEGEAEGVDPAAVQGPGGEEEAAKVNINTATVEELVTLNGIGEKKAQLFIDYREEQGLFMKLEDIKNIPGIGDKTFESLEPYITID
ncbi:helix-hairpin-helix domain-containing protein [Salinicoccus luteus]|uniref:helix-hairpin-helix domain-containing protein n=1 Tax=Salinicoccus luteus TaxID=367840 RepID=UPI00068EC4E6|nr:helix-hairpin-helix domain-containing protein [Salinicoccus luteus]